MKTIQIKQIKIEGFYGQTRTVNFSPTETVIRGDVKLGKTTIINAFTWCLLGIDLESRANYMLYDQTVEYSRDFAGQARVEVTLMIDGQEFLIVRTAKQKWLRDRNRDEWIKASSDEYKYFIDDLELTKGEFDAWIENKICHLRKLAMIANIDQWRKHSWRTLREMFQEIVGEITKEDFKQDYSTVLGVINEIGIEKARQQFRSRATKYDNELERLEIEEEATKRGLMSTDEIEHAERRIQEINDEIDELDRKQSAINADNAENIKLREEIAKEIAAKERMLRDETEAYDDSYNARRRELRNAYNDAVETNRRNKHRREVAAQRISLADEQIVRLEQQRTELRSRYKAANAQLFDGKCPMCGNTLIGDKAKSVASDFEKQKDMKLRDITRQGEYVSAQIKQCQTDKAQCERELADMKDADEQSALKAYQTCEGAHVPYAETERGKQYAQEIDELREKMPQVTWATDVDAILHRKGELRTELQQQTEIYSQKMSNNRIMEMLEEIERSRTTTVQSQMANAKSMRLVEEYERELAEIIRYRANKLFPERTEVIMSKYKKNGDIDFDVCQIEINGKDATATNTADRMNAGIDISTVFMRYYGLNFPLFVDGAESNTTIENYGRQMITTVVDEKCKQITIEAK